MTLRRGARRSSRFAPPFSGGGQALAASCLPRAAFAGALATQHGERALWAGIGQGGVLVQGFVNPLSGSWTLAVTTPEGVTCLLLAGQAFTVQALPVVVPGVPG